MGALYVNTNTAARSYISLFVALDRHHSADVVRYQNESNLSYDDSKVELHFFLLRMPHG